MKWLYGNPRHRRAYGAAMVAVLIGFGCSSLVQGPEPSLEVQPRRVAAGEEVTLRAEGLPPSTLFRIGAGPPASEYEPFASATSDADGALVARVRLPEWARSGSQLIFAIADPQTSMDLLSEPVTIE